MGEIGEIPLEHVWKIRQNSLWPDRPLDFVKIDQDAEAWHIGILYNEQWISCLSVFFEGAGLAQFRKFGTLVAFQGQGFGSQLITYMFESLKSKGIHSVYCSARVEKTAFYERFGMQKAGCPYEKNQKQYIRMELTLTNEP
jgi:predicted GNAT family N-acyltransferase